MIVERNPLSKQSINQRLILVAAIYNERRDKRPFFFALAHKNFSLQLGGATQTGRGHLPVFSSSLQQKLIAHCFFTLTVWPTFNHRGLKGVNSDGGYSQVVVRVSNLCLRPHTDFSLQESLLARRAKHPRSILGLVVVQS